MSISSPSATATRRGPSGSPRELGADAYTDFHALLARPDIDAVSICLPDREHTEAAVAAAEAEEGDPPREAARP